MTHPALIRKAILKKLPDLKFTIRKVSFQDLARDEVRMVSSPDWGPVAGNHEAYQKVKEICKQFPGVVVSWDA